MNYETKISQKSRTKLGQNKTAPGETEKVLASIILFQFELV